MISAPIVKKEDIFDDLFLEQDCQILYKYVKGNKPNKLLEIGTGATTISIAKALTELSEETKQNCIMSDKFVSVDIDKHRTELTAEELRKINPNGVALVNSDSIAYIANYCIKGTYDFIFIDSSHTLQQTVIELTFAQSLLSNQGVIFLHDTKLQSVIMAIYLLLENNPQFEFHDYNTHYGLGVIKRK